MREIKTGTKIAVLFLAIIITYLVVAGLWQTSGWLATSIEVWAAQKAETETTTQEAVYTIEDLLDAIEWVESKGDAYAIGDDGEVGAYQLKKIYVDDVNRITKMPGFKGDGNGVRCTGFSYNSRFDVFASRYMTSVYIRHYGGTFEEMARIHNGGPNGYKKESTLKYWLKVKARMEAVKQ